MTKSNHESPTPVAERFAGAVTAGAGSTLGFLLAVLTVVAWCVTGPFFGFSDTWQLVINTGTTIVTFLMVFLIQRAQNKESLVIQLKLNEIVAAIEGASNRLISVEELTEEDLQILRGHYHRLATMAQKESSLRVSHSVEEATRRHERKSTGANPRPPEIEARHDGANSK